MQAIRVTISRIGRLGQVGVASRTVTIPTESSKPLTKGRVARLIADKLPSFRRSKGRSSAFAGVEVLPVLEETPLGWRAWRLHTGNNRPSGFEPPLKGRVGRSNSRNNPHADRAVGVWEVAEIEVFKNDAASAV